VPLSEQITSETVITPPEQARLTNALFVVGGVIAIAVAILRLRNDIDYLPTDPRSQPWFDPVVSSVLVIVGVVLIAIGVVRLIRARREPGQ
jgi:hypothetical protein